MENREIHKSIGGIRKNSPLVCGGFLGWITACRPGGSVEETPCPGIVGYGGHEVRRVRSCQGEQLQQQILICYYLSQVSSEFWCRIPRIFFCEREGYIWAMSPSFTTEVCQKICGKQAEGGSCAARQFDRLHCS